MTASQRLVVVTDGDGRVVAGYYVGEPTGQYTAGMRALPGQHLHEVDLPAEFVGAEPGDVLRGLGAYRVRAGALQRREG